MLLCSAVIFSNCKRDAKDSSNASTETEKVTEGSESGDEAANNDQDQGDVIIEMEELFSPSFEEAKLKLKSPRNESRISEGPVKFDFEVEGYELGAQTSDAATKGLANSAKGQHIHLILNNGPYSAHYDPSFEQELEDGHYVMLAFLSRSYHESVKSKGAYVARQFTVGDEEFVMNDLSTPHLIYSRPKGDYKGADTDNLLLDFYLLNCDLSPEGYTVLAEVNGQEFTITKWAPYVLKGLPKGKVDIKLTLLDKDGAAVISPFNPSIRSVNLLD